MNEIDMSKLDVAIKYIKRMSEGHNPVTNQFAEDSVLENANVVRCLYFVADVLEKVRDNNGVIGGKVAKTTKKSAKAPFSCEVLKKFQYREDTYLSYVIKQINEAVDTTQMKPLSRKKVSEALKLEGYLEEVQNENGNTKLRPTEKGKSIGIYTVQRVSVNGIPYNSVLYSEKAQQFLVENIEQLL